MKIKNIITNSILILSLASLSMANIVPTSQQEYENASVGKIRCNTTIEESINQHLTKAAFLEIKNGNLNGAVVIFKLLSDKGNSFAMYMYAETKVLLFIKDHNKSSQILNNIQLSEMDILDKNRQYEWHIESIIPTGNLQDDSIMCKALFEYLTLRNEIIEMSTSIKARSYLSEWINSKFDSLVRAFDFIHNNCEVISCTSVSVRRVHWIGAPEREFDAFCIHN